MNDETRLACLILAVDVSKGQGADQVVETAEAFEAFVSGSPSLRSAGGRCITVRYGGGKADAHRAAQFG